MLNDLLEILQELLKKILGSRLFALAAAFTGMFIILLLRLFHLQIVDGEKYLNDYVQMTEKTVATPGTRGNIYDRNGNLLAYNKLAYSVTVQDVGAYPKKFHQQYAAGTCTDSGETWLSGAGKVRDRT